MYPMLYARPKLDIWQPPTGPPVQQIIVDYLRGMCYSPGNVFSAARVIFP